MRAGFTFYKSFDDTFNILNDSQKLVYLKTLLDVEFLRVRVQDVYFDDVILNAIWISTKHTIQTSIKGYLDSQKKSNVEFPFFGCYNDIKDPFLRGDNTPSQGVRQQGKGKGECKGEDEWKCKDEKSNITEVDFLKTGQAKDNAHMAIRAHLHNLDDEGYFKILNDFYIEQIGKAKIWTNQRETQAHFVSWAKKQPFDKKPEPPKKKTAQEFWVP